MNQMSDRIHSIIAIFYCKQNLRYMTLLFIHVKHVLEIRLTELLLALIRRSRITLIASTSQACRVGNHYPPLHNGVLGEETKENQ